MASFPNIEKFNFYDFKNLNSHDILNAQAEYSQKIAKVLDANLFPIGLDGNTQRLIDTANDFGVFFIDDVFDVSYAPGVSAPTIMVLDPKTTKLI